MAGIGSWSLDIATGVLKNNTLSRDLLKAAYEKTVAMDTVKTYGFGKHRGQSLTIPRIVQNAVGTTTFYAANAGGSPVATTGNLMAPADASLAELSGVPEDSFSITEASIVCYEYGRTIPYTSLQEDLLAFDLESEVQDMLRNQMALVLDTLAITAHKAAKVVYVPAANGVGTITTNGTAGAAATAELTADHVDFLSLYLRETLLAPPFSGEDYLALVRMRTSLSIRRSQPWVTWHSYTNPEQKYNGEIGRYENVRFLETNHWAALRDTASGVGTQAIIMGQTPVGMIEAVSPELRAEMPSDLGRKKLIGWYGVLGFAELWGTANPRQAKSIFISSST